MSNEGGLHDSEIQFMLDNFHKFKAESEASRPYNLEQTRVHDERLWAPTSAVQETHRCDHDCRDYIECIDRKLNLFKCRKSGLVHHCKADSNCSPTLLNADNEVICLWSGIIVDKCYLEANEKSKTGKLMCNEDEEEGGLKADKAKLKRNTLFRVLGLAEAIHQVCFDLLWNKERRKILSKKRFAEIQVLKREALEKYVKSCKRNRFMLSLSEMVTIFLNAGANKVWIPELTPNEELYLYQRKLIPFLWDVVQKSEERFDLGDTHALTTRYRQFIVGALYIQQQEFTRDGIPLIPQSTYLYFFLPSPNDIHYFSSERFVYSKKDITNGKNLIKKALRKVKHLILPFDV